MLRATHAVTLAVADSVDVAETSSATHAEAWVEDSVLADVLDAVVVELVAVLVPVVQVPAVLQSQLVAVLQHLATLLQSQHQAVLFHHVLPQLAAACKIKLMH